MAPGPGPGGGPGYPHQSQYMSPAMAANAQRYMMGQVRPGHIPMSGHSYSPQVMNDHLFLCIGLPFKTNPSCLIYLIYLYEVLFKINNFSTDQVSA